MRLGKGKTILAALALVAVLVAAPLVASGATATALLRVGTDWVERYRLLDDILRLVEANFKGHVDETEFLRGAIRGALGSLNDKHTSYMNNIEWEQYLDSMKGKVVGIGAYVESKDEYITIVAPIKGGPAEAADLRSGDRILMVDGTNLVGVALERAVTLIRGPAGTGVKLKIERPDEERVFELTITRAVVSIPVIEHRVEGEIGYIKLYGFDQGAGEKLRAAIASLKAAGVKGLLLDLRGNPGGFLNEAVDIAGNWVPNGEVILRAVSRGGEVEEIKSTGTPVGLPTLFLVNEGSASASEVVTGAVQDYGTATVAGTKTFGKGSVQSLLEMSAGGGLKLTVAEYLTPRQRKVDGVGLTPEVEIRATAVDKGLTLPLQYQRVLIRHMVGVDVLQVQERLAALGYYEGLLDGWLGPLTVAAVTKFQAERQLSATYGTYGIVDRPFITALNAAMSAHAKAEKERDRQLQEAFKVLRQQMRPAA